jgi:hypothetical protein
MKKQVSILSFAWIFLAGILASVSLSSCKKDAAEDTAAPSISGVTTLDDRSTQLGNGTYSQWILIKGAHLATTFKVDFNGVLAADSLIWANDTSVTVKIPGPLPGATSNPITVYTKYGSATYEFTILQPAPTITGFNPVSGGAGDMVTITGDWFTNLISVKFGTIDATIVSSNKTEIKVEVPAGVSQAYIFVTTSGGTTQSASAFGFRFVVYDDALNSMFWAGGWGGTADYNSTEVVKRGTKSIKVNYAGGWGSPIQIGGGTLDLSTYVAIKISIYGGPGTNFNKVKLTINGSASNGQELILREGQWTDFTIPLNTLGSPATLNEIWVQEFSGVGGVIYVDDFGLI